MRKLLVLVIVLFIGLFFFHQWWNRFPPFDGHGEPVDLTYAELGLEDDEVRVKGMVHHVLKASTLDPGGPFQPERRFWIAPFFGPGDTDSRTIRVFLASLSEPPWGIDFEELEVEGWIRPLRARVTVEIEDALVGAGYDIDAQAFVIEMFSERENQP